MTDPTPRLPDFLVIGAAKAGTTTLHAHLTAHRQLFLAEPKEPDFFSSEEKVRTGLGDYAALFADARPSQLVGEMSTTYSRWPHTDDAARLVAEHCPDVRLVYVLRHPVDRAFSHYAHHMRHGVTATFEQALARDDVYVDCSRYDMQLRRWERFHPSDRILLVRFEELVEQPGGVVRRIGDHLGVDLGDEAATDLAANVRGEHHLRARLEQMVGTVPALGALIDVIPDGPRRRAFRAIRDSPLGRRVRSEVVPPPMRDDTRQRLLEVLSEDVRAVEDRTGWDLASWRG